MSGPYLYGKESNRIRKTACALAALYVCNFVQLPYGYTCNLPSLDCMVQHEDHDKAATLAEVQPVVNLKAVPVRTFDPQLLKEASTQCRVGWRNNHRPRTAPRQIAELLEQAVCKAGEVKAPGTQLAGAVASVGRPGDQPRVPRRVAAEEEWLCGGAEDDGGGPAVGRDTHAATRVRALLCCRPFGDQFARTLPHALI